MGERRVHGWEARRCGRATGGRRALGQAREEAWEHDIHATRPPKQLTPACTAPCPTPPLPVRLSHQIRQLVAPVILFPSMSSRRPA